MLTQNERRNWFVGILAAAVGGYLTVYAVHFAVGVEKNPLSALHVTGESYAVVKVVGAFVLFPVVGYTTRYLRSRPARYETTAVALVLVGDAALNIYMVSRSALSPVRYAPAGLFVPTAAVTCSLALVALTDAHTRLTSRLRSDKL